MKSLREWATSEGLRGGLFKGSSVADYWRQMAARGQRLSLGNTQSQPCSGWRDTDTLGFYVFAFGEFQSLQLRCLFEQDRETVWWEVRGAGTWPCHSNMICGCRVQVQQLRPAGLECASDAQTARSDLKCFLWLISQNFFSSEHRELQIKIQYLQNTVHMLILHYN